MNDTALSFGPEQVPLSVLDLAPVPDGGNAGDALRATIDLARHAERLGFRRFWVAEHHNMPGIASSAPPVLIGHIADATATMRVGSGGVMLPNHVSLVVAEQFGMLEALHPGRIDLGIGRAPGTDQVTAAALRRSPEALSADDFPDQLMDLLGFFTGRWPEGHPFARITAVPGRGHLPAMWLLGSSGYSAQVAGLLGLPFAFAHHFSPANTLPALALYRSHFRPSDGLERPYAMVAAAVLCADTDERARFLAGSGALSFLRLRSGRPGPLPSPEEAAAYPYDDLERAFVEDRQATQILGAPETVRRGLADLLQATAADELMLTTMVYDPADRLASFELVAALAGAPSVGGLGPRSLPGQARGWSGSSGTASALITSSEVASVTVIAFRAQSVRTPSVWVCLQDDPRPGRVASVKAMPSYPGPSRGHSVTQNVKNWRLCISVVTLPYRQLPRLLISRTRPSAQEDTMAELTGPETAAPPAGPETAAPPAGAGPAAPRDASHWAAKVDRLQVEAREGVRGTNVAGKRLTGPVQGFGKLWQKTYSVDVGPGTSPQDAIAVWKAHFPEFWPEGNRFAGALTGISPGDVALLDIAVGGGVKMSTGVFVLYADAESFTFATPQGHQFAGWITFSAERSGEATVVQTQVLLRAGDPLYELGMPVMHRMEDRFWVQTMTALAERLGVADPAVQTRSVVMDPKRQWRRAGNVWYNAMARSVLQTVVPVRRRPRA